MLRSLLGEELINGKSSFFDFGSALDGVGPHPDKRVAKKI
jgi:hypothetical protein